MKGHSVFQLCFESVFPTVFAAIFSLFFALSCKSAEIPRHKMEVEEVEPLLLLDGKSSIYMRLPSSADKHLVSRILQNSIEGLSSGNAALVAERVGVIYAGVTRSRTTVSFQISADCNFPAAFTRRVFSEKNGWSEEKLSLKNGGNGETSYSIYTADTISVSFPNDFMVCVGRDIDKMLLKYHSLAFPFEDFSSDEKDSSLLPKGVDSLRHGVYDYLLYDKENPDEAIKFFTSRPQSFLPMLIGSTLNFNLVYTRGEILPDKKNSNQVTMRLELEFKDSKYIPFGRGALSVAFGLSESDIYLESPTHLVVENIKISRELLYRMLVL